MALEHIIRKIDEDARAEAESLLSLARAEADSIKEKARKQAEELRAELLREAEKKAKEHANRIQVLAGLEQRKETLKEKRNLVEEAFTRAEEKIRTLAPDEYCALLKPLIVSAVESGREEIIPSAAHRHLFTPDFLKEINDELGPQRSQLRLSEESGDFAAGFILRESNKETNLTLESIIKDRRDQIEPSIAAILFGEDGKNG
ncbi:MAG: hypothetical protein C4532_02645 [Candidatus Abyssobacteria bacterium SURF_17]|jgi:V/A-type H+-transporting ATPase subunit E|uniref:V-type proton ATPase subunit E n=1 Tax=Candidatus Abyssobacteria bacterium SURF_17 TaxID=2093361 RepID=A0A419F7V7_9BACT|nr:MAG: hypothetical protein C4532_02645 [Candidatus Abyssubacteria bacterium SURF_17]